MKNPLKKYKTLNSACKIVGFEVEIPPRFKIKDIYVVADSILELRFASVVVRKAKYNKEISSERGISGVYPGAYPNDCNRGEFQTQEIKGYELWNGSAKNPKSFLSVWDDNAHNYSYSVYAPKGIKLKAMSKWQKMFK